MKFIKLYESFEDIDTICKKYFIENYTINSDGTVDVDGNVYLSDIKLTKLPLKFSKVSGYFDCSDNKLTSLEGSPHSVGDFNCNNNKLTSLKGCPQSVVNFECFYNKLTSLEFCPQSVGGDFNCSINSLTTLEFCPKSVGGDFICNNNELTTLEGCPQSVGGDFYCYYNELTTLECSPQSVGGDFSFGVNKLRDLYGFPEFFDNEVDYIDNPVSEILDLFEDESNRLGKVIDLLNEYGVIQQDGKVVILDRLEEIFHTLNMEIPKEITLLMSNLKNYEVY